MGLLFRVLLGYIVACLVAGLSTVLFAWSPNELANMHGDAANDKLALALPVAMHIFLFASVPAVIAFMFGERHRRRDWLYYAGSGIVIALLGFAAQHMSEDTHQTWHIADNSYPLLAFIVTGFLSGLAFWIVAGRHAGLRPGAPTPVNKPFPAGTGKPTTTTSNNRPNTQRT